MNKTLGALVAASILTLTATACEVPEDSGTAADRSEVNSKKAGKDSKAKAKSDAPKETAGQENARESAENYLDLSRSRATV